MTIVDVGKVSYEKKSRFSGIPAQKMLEQLLPFYHYLDLSMLYNPFSFRVGVGKYVSYYCHRLLK